MLKLHYWNFKTNVLCKLLVAAINFQILDFHYLGQQKYWI